MAATKGKRVAMWAGALGILVLVATGIAMKDRIREEWWLHQLENGDDAQKFVAARKLAETGSARAVQSLLRFVDWKLVCGWLSNHTAEEAQRSLGRYSMKAQTQVSLQLGLEIEQALRDVGEAGELSLIEATVSEDRNARLGAVFVLLARGLKGAAEVYPLCFSGSPWSSAPRVGGIRLVLRSLQDDERKAAVIRQAAGVALNKIQDEQDASPR